MSVNGTWTSIQVSPATVIGARFHPGKVSLPVSNMHTYASFDHVRGVPSPVEGGGYSISRLQIINSILERMTASETLPEPASVDEASERLASSLQKSVYGSAYGNYIAGESLSFSA